MKKRAIVVVDLQNEYLPEGKLPLVGIDEATGNAARVIDAARSRGEPVVHIRHENPRRDAPFFVPGTPGVEIIARVIPRPGEPVVVKHYPNSFRETGLEKLLDAESIDEIVVIGAMSHMCVDATARAAADLGYGVTVVDDACATMDLKHGDRSVPAAQVHAAHMAALAFAYASVVLTSALLAPSSK
jgi:nicotinamidase-related amidase